MPARAGDPNGRGQSGEHSRRLALRADREFREHSGAPDAAGPGRNTGTLCCATEGHLMHCCWRQGEFEISTDSSKVDLALVHEFLTNSYWAKGIPIEVVTRSVENSLCFGIYDHEGR